MSTTSTSRLRRLVSLMLLAALLSSLTTGFAAAVAPLEGPGTVPIPGTPTAITGAATGVGSTSATLNGTVNANGSSTTVVFEYGLDTFYGNTWPADQSPVSGSKVAPWGNGCTPYHGWSPSASIACSGMASVSVSCRIWLPIGVSIGAVLAWRTVI